MHSDNTSHVGWEILLHRFTLSRGRFLQPKPATQHSKARRAEMQALLMSHFASSLSELGLTKQMLLQPLDGEPSKLHGTSTTHRSGDRPGGLYQLIPTKSLPTRLISCSDHDVPGLLFACSVIIKSSSN